MTGHRKRNRGLALMLVMILVVVAGILGMSYVVSSTVQMISSDNLLRVSRARYLGESGLEHATWMLRSDPDAPAALQNISMGPFNVDGTADSYVFVVGAMGNGLYDVTGTGTASPLGVGDGDVTAMAAPRGISQTISMTLQLRSYYAKIMTALSPMCYWRMGEPSGTIAADLASGISGTYHGVSVGMTGTIAGDSNTSARFDGTASYVDVPHSDAFLLDNGTVLLWFRASVIKRAGLFSKDSKGRVTGGQLTIETHHHKVELRFQGKSADYNLSSQDIVADQWYFVAFTFGGNGMKLYLNGELVDGNPYTGGMGRTSGGIGNHEPMAIGASTRDTITRKINPLREYFPGRIDEVAVFSRALSAKQIKDLYDARIAEATIVAWDK